MCLMQKYIDRGSDLQIRSVVALDHLKNYIYVEADKEAHVKEVFVLLLFVFINVIKGVKSLCGLFVLPVLGNQGNEEYIC